MDPTIILFGLGVGMLVGITGMGGGSLMTPLLILVFGMYFARFAGGACEDYAAGQHAVYLAKGEDAKLWPSEVLSNFLDLQVLEPLPARFRSVVPQ